MERTLKSIAKKYRTNKPTVNARLKKLEREHPELILTSIGENHTILLTDTGLMLLEEDLKLRPVQPKKKSDTKTDKKASNMPYISDKQYLDALELLKKQNEILESEIAIKNKQIDKLTEVINRQQETINKTLKTITETHILLGREQDRPALTTAKQQEAGQQETPPRPSQRPKTFLAKLLDKIL